MPRAIPQLRTPGVIAEEVGAPVTRVLYVLRKHRDTIKPIGRAGILRLYDATATDLVRKELSKNRDSGSSA